MEKKKRLGRITMVLGLQFGSEGKGAVTSYLAPGCSMGIRSGAANAGHTIYYNDRKFIMRQIPSVWINPIAQLIVAIGSIINLDVLLKEIGQIEAILPIRHRLFIDSRAHVITKKQILAEQKTDLAKRIGSTSATSREGIGTATADKVLRKASCLQAKDVEELKPFLCDTVELINQELDNDELIILEGTQGFGLDIDHGYFPYVTSRNLTASALAASIGVSSHAFDVEVIGVARTYPIRVAGNSGPFGKNSRELTWQQVTRRAKAEKLIIETTSVTKKVRRVATFSKEEFLRACRVNRPTEIALTFTDYLDWQIHEKEEISKKVENFIAELEKLSGIQVALVKTGPKTIIDFDWYRRSMLRKISI